MPLLHAPYQLTNEKTVLFLRRHWLILFQRLLLWGVLAILPIIVTSLVGTPSLSPNTQTVAVVFMSIYYVALWLFSFYSFFDYYLDIWVVTTERIINIEQLGLFARTVSEQRLDRVQDLTSEVKGLLPTLFGYGTVFIQTAGKEERFIFEQIPNPQQVIKQVIVLVEQHKATSPNP